MEKFKREKRSWKDLVREMNRGIPRKDILVSWSKNKQQQIRVFG